MTDYLLLIHPAEEGGYWAEIPALDGCFAQGETIEEVIAEARDAISSHIEALKESGDPVPSPSPVVLATVSVPAA